MIAKRTIINLSHLVTSKVLTYCLLLLASSFWLLAVASWQSVVDGDLAHDNKIRAPSSVYRLPTVTFHVAHKFSRTVHGQRSTVIISMSRSKRNTPLAASSQQPEAILRTMIKAVLRHPFTVYRPSHLMWHISSHARFTVNGRRSTVIISMSRSKRNTPLAASSQKPEAILRVRRKPGTPLPTSPFPLPFRSPMCYNGNRKRGLSRQCRLPLIYVFNRRKPP